LLLLQWGLLQQALRCGQASAAVWMSCASSCCHHHLLQPLLLLPLLLLPLLLLLSSNQTPLSGACGQLRHGCHGLLLPLPLLLLRLLLLQPLLLCLVYLLLLAQRCRCPGV
jgi:hypothetical protein